MNFIIYSLMLIKNKIKKIMFVRFLYLMSYLISFKLLCYVVQTLGKVANIDCSINLQIHLSRME